MNVGGFRAVRARAAMAAGIAHATRFAYSGDVRDLERAAAACRRALALTSENDPAYPEWLSDLGDILSRTFDSTEERALLDEALVLQARAVRAAPPGHPAAGRARVGRGIVLMNDFRVGGPPEHLDQAADLFGEAVALLPDGDPLAVLALSNHAEAHRQRYARDGDMADLREHAAKLRAVVAATPADDSYFLFRTAKLASALVLVSDEPGAREELGRALDTVRAGLPGVPEPMRREIHLIAGALLYGEPPSLDAEQLAAMREIFVSMRQQGTTGAGLRAAVLSDLGSGIVAQAMRSGRIEDVDGAIAMLRDALAEAPQGHPGRAALLTNLGRMLGQRMEWSGELGGADEMIAVLGQAVDAAPAGDPERGLYLANLANALALKHGVEGGDALLERLTDVYRQAVEQTAADHPERGVALTGLASARFAVYERWGRRADLDACIEGHRAAVDATPVGHDYRPLYLANLGSALGRRHEMTGSVADLDEAIAVMRECVALTPPVHPHSGGWASALATVLIMRFDRTGEHKALEEAIDTYRRALERAPKGHLHRHMILTNLGRALTRRDTPEALEEAVEVARAAAAAAPAANTGAAIGLATALQLRFVSLEDGALTADERLALALSLLREDAPPSVPDLVAGRRLQQTELLDEAVAILREVVRRAPRGDHAKVTAAGQLGMALRLRSLMTGKGRQLDSAIRALREAVDGAAEDEPVLSVSRLHLAEALADRWERSGDEHDRIEAVEQFAAAAAVATAAPAWRAGVAKRWGAFVAENDGPAAAADAFAAAVGLLDAAAWRGMRRQDQERALAEFQGLACDAAACAIAAGLPERAVELLEQGRGVLLAQIIDARPVHDELERHAPSLAARLADIQDGLDTVEDLDTRHVLAREREETLTEIRARPGLAGFLLPPPFATLRAAAQDGPVVVVNVSVYRCDALIVTAGGVRLVPLPGLSSAAVAESAAAFVDALDAYTHDDDPDPGVLERVPATLDWLAERVGRPVLDAIGLHAPPEGTWPRLWWCPTGALSLLPLHAVALDVAVSSYTPTLRALAHARREAGPHAEGRPLLVALPSTPGEEDLPGAERESEAVRRMLRDTLPLVGPDAVRAAVLDALPSSPWVHFACHAEQDPAAPSEGRLVLHDGPLTVRELAATRLDRAEFAFLSGCETSRGGDLLADEGVSLAATVQLAGYPSVIGTLWPIADLHAPGLVEDVYAMMTAGGTREPDPRAAALGLHLAVRALRERHPDAPILWAPFTHIGP
ncbi:CHAT domain-containing protein [Nonomuraea sp. NPDC049152]|uniref:CHAT domain-containing protein n=1 Tax=Nonomuraea sp. NPDC049152 TaxID=3154350 RepID=UPI0033C152AF